jgi:hypothetical protein
MSTFNESLLVHAGSDRTRGEPPVPPMVAASIFARLSSAVSAEISNFRRMPARSIGNPAPQQDPRRERLTVGKQRHQQSRMGK